MNGGLYKPTGLSVPGLFEHAQRHGTVKDYPEGRGR